MLDETADAKTAAINLSVGVKNRSNGLSNASYFYEIDCYWFNLIVNDISFIGLDGNVEMLKS